MEHAAQASNWAAAVEASGLGVLMRQASWAYPAANVAHLLGLVLLAGPILLFDLRVLGLGARVPMAEVSRLLTPFALAGLAVLAVSGPLMFVADARSLSGNVALLAKLALVVVALANAVLFRALWRLAPEEAGAVAPIGARIQALASIGLWFTIAGLGRMIAYV